MEFPRQEYWSGVPFPTPGDLPDPGIKLTSFAPPALAGGFFTTEPPGKQANFHHPQGSDILDMTWNMNVSGSSQVALVVKNLLADAGDMGNKVSILELGRSPGGGNDSPLQCSCLENSMDRGVWRATVHGVTKSQTQMKWLSTHTYTHTHSWMSPFVPLPVPTISSPGLSSTKWVKEIWVRLWIFYFPDSFPRTSCSLVPVGSAFDLLWAWLLGSSCVMWHCPQHTGLLTSLLLQLPCLSTAGLSESPVSFSFWKHSSEVQPFSV